MSATIATPNRVSQFGDVASSPAALKQPGCCPEITQGHLETTETKREKCHKPRAAWRQRLVQAERGIGNGARQDSIVFVHVFTSTLILLAGGVLGLAAWQWLAVCGSLVLLFVAELFNQALKSMAQAFGETPPPPVQQALGMSTAASMLALCGALVIAACTLGQRMLEILG